MASIVIRVVKRDDPGQVAEAQGELEGAGYTVTSEEADLLAVDTTAYGGGKKRCRNAVILTGKKG
jgi:hypothetical protein